MTNQSTTANRSTPRSVGILLFGKFELLDVFGPAQLFGVLKNKFEIVMIGQQVGPVVSGQGPTVLVDKSIDTIDHLDILIIPGGMGTRVEVKNQALLKWIKDTSSNVEFVCSVCTGAALLAKAGLLDNRQATSNKYAFEWVTSQGPDVSWVKQARWVVDGKYWTSSGVSAGIDMALAMIEHIEGAEVANIIANVSEYDRHADANWDPFAALYEATRD